MGSSVATLLLTLVIFALVPLARPLTAEFEALPPHLRYLFLPIGFGILFIFISIWRSEQNELPVIPKQRKKIITAFLLASFAGAYSLCVIAIEYCHIPVYGSLGFFALGHVLKGREYEYSLTTATLRALLLCCFVGALDEMLQGLHPERFFDLRDILLNGLSSISGISLRLLVSKAVSPLSSPQNL